MNTYSLEDIVNLVEKLELRLVPKRFDNDWDMRYTWEVKSNGKIHECAWKGFYSLKTCIDDLNKKIDNIVEENN